jgi:hypothetical protein
MLHSAVKRSCGRGKPPFPIRLEWAGTGIRRSWSRNGLVNPGTRAPLPAPPSRARNGQPQASGRDLLPRRASRGSVHEEGKTPATGRPVAAAGCAGSKSRSSIGLEESVHAVSAVARWKVVETILGRRSWWRYRRVQDDDNPCPRR